MALEKAGYRTGQYLSPHVTTIRERVQVNQELVSKDFIIDFINFVNKHPRLFSELSYFDFTTLIALKYWEIQEVEISTLEVGLGGRLDSTNLIPDPILSVITSIGLDHTEMLGDTIPKIASEKLGIVKPGRPLLRGRTVPYKQAYDYCR